MKASIKKDKENAIQKYLDGLVDRTKGVSSYLNRNLMRAYQQAQLDRFQTENSSQGEQWMPLNPSYLRFKRKKFASYPGGGSATMIATGRLKDGATAKNSNYYYKLVTDKKFEIGINLSALPYAKYPGVLRPYMKFNKQTIDEWRRDLSLYIRTGRSR